MKVDFLTVVYSIDLELLKLQARSIARFVDPELINQIVVVIKDNTLGFADHVCSIRPLYGVFADRVLFLDYTDVVNKTDLEFNNEYYNIRDWISSQVARLLASRIIKSDWYINLDCKNIFIGPINETTFFYNNRAKEIGLAIDKDTLSYSWWPASCEYFKFDGSLITPQQCYSPFIFVTQEVRNLINYSNNTPLAYSLMDSYCSLKDMQLADIFLYCAWLHYQDRYSMYYCDSPIWRGSILNYHPTIAIYDIHRVRDLPTILQNPEKQAFVADFLVNQTGLLTNSEWTEFILHYGSIIKN